MDVDDTRDTAPSEPAVAPAGRRARRGRLDGRTLAICVVVALVVALAAGLVAGMVLDDGDAPDREGPVAELERADGAAGIDRLTSVELVTPDGEPTSLAAYLGHQFVVLNFWQRSCVPCVTEMPLLEQAAQDNPELVVLGANTQESLEDAQAIATQTGITYDWVRDPSGDLFYAAEGSGMPTTLILAPNGSVLARKTGAFTDQADLQGWLDEHVA